SRAATCSHPEVRTTGQSYREWRQRVQRGALEDRTVEQASARRRDQIGSGICGAGGLTTERNSRGVTAKRGGIALYPAERSLDVHDAVIGEGMVFRVQRGMRQEAKETQAVIDCYNHRRD